MISWKLSVAYLGFHIAKERKVTRPFKAHACNLSQCSARAQTRHCYSCSCMLISCHSERLAKTEERLGFGNEVLMFGQFKESPSHYRILFQGDRGICMHCRDFFSQHPEALLLIPRHSVTSYALKTAWTHNQNLTLTGFRGRTI